MGTFFTSKHGLGSRGPGGTPPSKPKSSTPPGLRALFCLLQIQLMVQKVIAAVFQNDRKHVGRNLIQTLAAIFIL